MVKFILLTFVSYDGMHDQWELIRITKIAVIMYIYIGSQFDFVILILKQLKEQCTTRSQNEGIKLN